MYKYGGPGLCTFGIWEDSTTLVGDAVGVFSAEEVVSVTKSVYCKV